MRPFKRSTLHGLAKRGSISYWTVALLMFVVLAASVKYRIIGADGRAWQSAINNDGKGYYEYLRAPLLEGPGAGDHGESWMFATAGEGKAIKYFVGTALFQAPFVLLAHTYTIFFSTGPEDGYSMHYHLAIILSAWSSLLLGLLFTRRLLIDMGHSDRAITLALVAITMGAGSLVQAVIHPGMSHVYSFAMVAALLVTVRGAFHHGSARLFALSGAILGLVIILRPVDALVLLAVPLVIADTKYCSRGSHAQHAILCALSLGVVLFIQSLAWYVQCGEWLIRPYEGEGFHWDRPAITEHLFSARNGLFFYWPILLMVVPGILIMYRRSRNKVGSLLLFLVAFGYVTSSWWNWSYGDSFGQRPYVDVLALLCIPLAAVFDVHEPWLRRLLYCLASAFIILNVFQSWQYAQGILVPARMDLRKYAHVMFRLDPARGRELGGIQDLPPYAPSGMLTALDTIHPWRPDRTNRMQWSIPRVTAGTGAWYVELEVTRTRSVPGTNLNDTLWVYGTGGWWPAMGIPFMLDQIPSTEPGVAKWKNNLRIPGQSTGDTLSLGHSGTGNVRIDSVHIKISAPR